jgi:manganese/zinc/iron transport system substrate-binding protein
MTTRRQALSYLAALGTAGMAQPLLAQNRPLSVVATTGMVADAARRVGGDAVEVVALMGAGVDPHSYRQTRTDIAALTRADLVLWHGLYLEAQMEEFLLELGERQPVVAVTDTLPRDSLLGDEEYEGRYDPHVWMDPVRWSAVVERIRDALSEVRPDSADIFAAAAADYLEEIAALHTYSLDVLDSVPESARVLVTAHDAFGYFGTAYGYEVLGIQGISTESEAGLARIRDLVSILVERGIGAVFVESTVSDRNIRALVEGAAAEGHEVRVGGELFSDAMGAPGTYEGTYLGMIDHNVTLIASALGGTAPERGRLGILSAGI